MPHAQAALPEPSADDLDWADFFAPVDPGLVFECNSTVFGRYDSVCVYRRLVVIDGALETGSGVEIPVGRITAWQIDLEADAARVMIRAGHEHVARIPRQFARALESALRDVVGSDPGRGAA